MKKIGGLKKLEWEDRGWKMNWDSKTMKIYTSYGMCNYEYIIQDEYNRIGFVYMTSN